MVDPAHPRVSRTAENGTINYAIAGDPWVPDLSNPILKPATREALRKIAEQELKDNPHLERTPWSPRTRTAPAAAGSQEETAGCGGHAEGGRARTQPRAAAPGNARCSLPASVT